MNSQAGGFSPVRWNDGLCQARNRRQIMKCHYCDKTNDLRPYGPKGAMVCFSCAMGIPERKAETGRNFAAQLDAAVPMALIDGTEAGPYPAEHNPDAIRLMGHNATELTGDA